MDAVSRLSVWETSLVKKTGSGISLTSRSVPHDGIDVWKTEISVSWPQIIVVNVSSATKEAAESLARARLCDILQEIGALDAANDMQQAEKRHGGVGVGAKSTTRQLRRRPRQGDVGTVNLAKLFLRALDDIAKSEISEVQPQKEPCENIRAAETSLRSNTLVPCSVLHQVPGMNGSHVVPSERLTKWTEMQELSRARSLVDRIYTNVHKLKGDKTFTPLYTSVAVQENGSYWTTTLKVKWPCNLSVEGKARTKGMAESLAAFGLIQDLTERGHIDCDLIPRTHSDQALRRHKSQCMAPHVLVVLPQSCVPTMDDIIHKFETVVSLAPCLPSDIESTATCTDPERIMCDIMTGQLLSTVGESQPQRDRELLARLEKAPHHASAVQWTKKALPIFLLRKNILRMLESEQVVVVCGETGSGKSTQMPQFIFEEFIRRGKGSSCNIVVTQPRRMAAISMASRVAYERAEELGDSVGFRAEVEEQLLLDRGGILFCTEGALLQHLSGNTQLLGISHVIVDEVHIRNLSTDFLLMLLREALRKNRTLRVVLILGTTTGTERLSRYFSEAPVMKVPVKMYPIQQYFLEDLMADNIVPANALQKDSRDMVQIVVEVLVYIMEMKPSGALLCFLPGRRDISEVYAKLCAVAPARFHEWILPLHSRMHYKEQQKIFSAPPTKVRKVILCTSLAETSIAVDDVVYVVNVGLQREQRFDPSTGANLLGTFPTSRASVLQRMNHAGRLRPGEFYHLYTRADFASREQVTLPKMQTADIARVVLDCKMFCPSKSVEDALSLTLDPPAQEKISKTIKDLQEMGMMNVDEELTNLGQCVVHFGTTPLLAKAIIHGALFGVMDTMITVAAALSNPPSMVNRGVEDASRGRRLKKGSSETTERSDHTALARICGSWDHETNSAWTDEFLENTRDALLLNLATGKNKWGLVVNSHTDNCELVLAALTPGLYPHVLQVLEDQACNSVKFACLDHSRTTISEESLLHRVLPVYEHPWLVHYNSILQPYKHQLSTVCNCSTVTSLHLLLFAGQGIHIIEDTFDTTLQDPGASKHICLVVDEQQLLKFRCTERDANLIWRWRRMLDYMVDLNLSLDQYAESSPEEDYLRRELWPEVVSAVALLLSYHQL